MTPDDLDRILSSEDLPEPSPRFAANVMARVRQANSEPPPLAFPWTRFLTGVAASGIAAVAGTVLLLRSAPALNPVAAAFSQLATVVPPLEYATAALFISFASVFVPRMLSKYD
jgi:hypothetical protein